MSGKFVVYKSSAGSGKTYTLVTEYLYLALSSANANRFKNILALTFTNKAAAEMKNRVIEFLLDLSKENGMVNNVPLLESLAERLSISTEELSERAGAMLSQILHNYADFSITTIDKFVHRLIRTFAKDLGLSNDFTVELDQTKLLEMAVTRLMDKVGIDPEITQTLLGFSALKVEDDKSWKIEDDLMEVGKMIFDEESRSYIEEIALLSHHEFTAIRKKAEASIKSFENRVEALGTKAIHLIREHNISPGDMAGGENGVFKYFTYLHVCRQDKLNPTPSIQKYFNNQKLYAGKTTKTAIEEIESITPELTAIFSEALTVLEQEYEAYQFYTLARPALYTMAVLGTLNQLLNEIKKELNIIPISDFNHKIAEIVLEEPAPFIYERMGEFYKNYLLDEFQDTSVMQWQNLLPLIENALGNGAFTLLVGDGKQSIYRFRNGEVEQFEALPKIHKSHNNPVLLEKELILSHHFEERILSFNYRSKENIVQFNNKFFELLAVKLQDPLSKVYQTIVQKPLAKNKGGYVCLKALHPEESNNEEEQFNQEIFNTIQECLSDGYYYKDIAILAIKNKTGVTIANYLLGEGIPVISSESLLVSGNAEVNFLVALLRFLTFPNDFAPVVVILGYLHKDHPKAILHEWMMTVKYHKDYISGNHYAALEKFLQNLNINICFSEINKHKPYQLLEDLITCFNLSKQNNSFLQFFMEAVFNLEQKKNTGKSEVLEWWHIQKNKLSIKTPEGTDAVNILTIHKSKGLEFPVVIVPYANWDLKPGKQNIWIPAENYLAPLRVCLVPMVKKLESTFAAPFYEEEKTKTLLDHINLLYVSFTRPEERLYVFTAKNQRNNNSVYTLIKDTVSQFGNGEINGTLEIGVKEKKEQTLQHGNFEKFDFQYPQPGFWHKKAVFGKPEAQEDTESMNYGNMMHEILAKTIKSTDLWTAVNFVLKDNNYSGFKRDEIFSKLNELIHLEQILPWFSSEKKVRTEVEIIDTDCKIYRLDRVIEKNREITVIDYKTGQYKPFHKDQLLGYASILKKMEYETIYLALVYIDLNEVKTLKF